MQKIQYFITAVPILLIGIFCCYYSKRLTLALIKSSKILNETFGIKKGFGKAEEICIQVALIIFGIIFILGGIRTIAEGLK